MDFLTDAGQWITQAASALAGIALALFAFALWQWIQLKARVESSRIDGLLDDALERETERLVKWAEQAFPGATGKEKLQKVMDGLRSVFPDAAVDTLRVFVENAVYKMNQEQTFYIQPALDMDELRSNN